MRRVFLAIAFLACAGAAWAADKPVLAPPGAWVKPIPVPVAAADPNNKRPVRNLLTEFQVEFTPTGTLTYEHVAMLIQSPAGLPVGSLALTWNPDTDTLVVHTFRILRGGKSIDVLRDQSFTVLRRETDLERAALNGLLTATLQPTGLQVGDIVEVAYTVERHDPTMRGHAEQLLTILPGLVVEHMRFREIWPTSMPIRWRETEGLDPAKVTKGPQETELLIEEQNAKRPDPPKGAPARYGYLSTLEATDFAHWSDASALFAPLFAKAATLAPDSPLKAEALKIEAASSDPKTRAAAALHLVQDKIRYLFLGMNLGGYVPASADLTWSRRFGDCKGKTVVLLALLHELGIQAEPVMVSTVIGDGMDERLPAVSYFDHVLVRAHIGGADYWLDGTRTGDRALDTIQPPDFRWGLPLEPQGADLVKIEQRPLASPLMDIALHIDASAGLDALAPTHLDVIFRGDLATALKVGVASVSADDLKKKLLDSFSGQIPGVEFKNAALTYDDASGEARMALDGAMALTWTFDPAQKRRVFDANNPYITSSAGGAAQEDRFKRDPGPDSDAPYAVGANSFLRATETITLPAGGKGFALVEDDFAKTLAGTELKRTSRLDGDQFTMTVSSRTLAPEFPAEETRAANIGLRELADARSQIEAPADYAPGDRELALRLARTPTLASEFVDRAEARMLKRDYDAAIQDFDAALKLNPDDPDLLNSRCFARGIADRTLDVAVADCDAAIEQKPHEAAYLDSRGFVYFRLGKMDKALADLNAALSVAPDQAPTLYVRGLLERRTGDAKHGDADVTAATALDPTVVATYAGYGVRM